MTARYATGEDADRFAALVDKQATDVRGNPLPWPSEDANGRIIPGSVGTTGIQAVEVDSQTREKRYRLDGIPTPYVAEALDPERSRLEATEQEEIETLNTRYATEAEPEPLTRTRTR